MDSINKDLLDRLVFKLGLSKSQVYRVIDAKVRSTKLPRNLAAIAVAGDSGINISKYASADDLSTMRQVALSSVPSPVVIHTVEQEKKGSKSIKPKKKISEPRRGNTVFVVHGRDIEAKNAMFSFLRAVGLRPLEWSQALKLVKKGAPYVGEILDAAFQEAAAVVVLITPDDDVKLRDFFITKTDPIYEKKIQGQARPNVLFEAGMAFGKNPNSTILVQIGNVKPFSDVGGRHLVRLNNQATSRQEFVIKLANAGCNVDTSGTDWLTIGNFVAFEKPKQKKQKTKGKIA